MGPQVTQMERKGQKRSPFGNPFFVGFTCSSFLALDARWGPEGCPSALQHPKMIKNQSKIDSRTAKSSPKSDPRHTRLALKLSSPSVENTWGNLGMTHLMQHPLAICSDMHMHTQAEQPKRKELQRTMHPE